MAMKKSIGRTLAHIDVAANSSVRIHKDFFNTHRDYHYLFQNATIETNGANQCLRIPVQCDRSPLYSAVACILRSVPWSAPRYARAKTESAPALHLRCGIDVRS